MQKHLFFPLLSMLFLFIGGCIQEGPWDHCPDFEVRRLTFQKEKKSPPNKKILSSSCLLRWNILGPIPPAGKSLEEPDMEGEESLCGFVNAPYPAMWRVKHFPIEPVKNPLYNRESDFTSIYKDVKKESVFYFCATLENPDGEKDILSHIASSGGIILFWNGKKAHLSPGGTLPEKEESIKLRLLPGKNRLVIKYRDGKEGSGKRTLSFRITLPKEGKRALIR